MIIEWPAPETDPRSQIDSNFPEKITLITIRAMLKIAVVKCRRSNYSYEILFRH